MTSMRTWSLALAAAMAAVPALADEAMAVHEQVEPPHVRASHHVDVIAPGERVQTVLDRMRASKPSPEGGHGQPATGRASAGHEDGPRGGGDGPGGGQGTAEEQGGVAQPHSDSRSDGEPHRHYLLRPKG
jgi:hypothetical protein